MHLHKLSNNCIGVCIDEELEIQRVKVYFRDR